MYKMMLFVCHCEHDCECHVFKQLFLSSPELPFVASGHHGISKKVHQASQIAVFNDFQETHGNTILWLLNVSRYQAETHPIQSAIYGMFTNIFPLKWPSYVGKYTIHGWHGYVFHRNHRLLTTFSNADSISLWSGKTTKKLASKLRRAKVGWSIVVGQRIYCRTFFQLRHHYAQKIQKTLILVEDEENLQQHTVSGNATYTQKKKNRSWIHVPCLVTASPCPGSAYIAHRRGRGLRRRVLKPKFWNFVGCCQGNDSFCLFSSNLAFSGDLVVIGRSFCVRVLAALLHVLASTRTHLCMPVTVHLLVYQQNCELQSTDKTK